MRRATVIFAYTVAACVILGTVVVYGLTAGPLAQRLGLSSAHPQGVMTLGAHAWGRALALALQDAGLRVLVVDANPSHIAQARMDGLKVYFGNVLADNAAEGRIYLDKVVADFPESKYVGEARKALSHAANGIETDVARSP